MRIFFFVILAITAAACASLDDRGDTPKARPSWTRHPPTGGDPAHAVGEASGFADKEEALESAWVNAIARLGLAEFPELMRITTRSVENLERSVHERRFAVKLELVDWSGLKEATDLGSPHVEYDPITAGYRAYRLVRWPRKKIEQARARISAGQRHRLPQSPEIRAEEEIRLTEALRSLQRVQDRLTRRSSYLDRVFKEVRCGITVDDLTEALGRPDRAGPYNAVRTEKTYYWGPYLVGHVTGNPRVAVVGRTDLPRSRRYLCGGRDEERFTDE